MEFNFTFKTRIEYLLAGINNDNMVFNIIRVVVKKPNGMSLDFPIRYEDEFIIFKQKLIASPDKLIQIYECSDRFKDYMESES